MPTVHTLKELSQARKDIHKLRLKDCIVLPSDHPESNPREEITPARIAEMAAMLKGAAGDDPDSNGQKEPARGRMVEGKFAFTTGNTRYYALSTLAKKEDRFSYIYVIPEPKDYTSKQRQIDHIVSNEGAPLKMSEQGTVYKRLRDVEKMTVKQIHVATGKTEQHIYDCLNLVDMAPSIREAVNAGKIAPSTVVKIAQKTDAAHVESAVKTSIAAAELDGKKKATAKHVPVNLAPKTTTKKRKVKKVDDMQGALTDLEKRVNDERMARVADYQADSVSKLQDALSATVPTMCVRDRRQAFEFVIDYLKGTKELTHALAFLKGEDADLFE